MCIVGGLGISNELSATSIWLWSTREGATDIGLGGSLHSVAVVIVCGDGARDQDASSEAGPLLLGRGKAAAGGGNRQADRENDAHALHLAKEQRRQSVSQFNALQFAQVNLGDCCVELCDQHSSEAITCRLFH